jgi:ankyrin repeat protein
VRIILGLVKDSRKVADLLVKRGPYILAGENYGSILLINALRYSRKDVARALMEKDLNFKLPADDGVTPLAYAVIFGHKKLGERLYNGGAYFYEPGMGEDETIRLARDNGHDEVVDFLVRMSTEKAPGEESSLAKAIKDGKLAVVVELLKRGADVNALDSSGDTPLYIAAGKGNPELVKLLLDAGADPNVGCGKD